MDFSDTVSIADSAFSLFFKSIGPIIGSRGKNKNGDLG